MGGKGSGRKNRSGIDWSDPVAVAQKKRGYAHPQAATQSTFVHGTNQVLTPDDVRTIRRRLLSESANAIARDYGVAQVTIWRIKHGITWKDEAGDARSE